MILAFNLNSAMKRLVLEGSWAAKRMKAIRFSLIGLPGRVVYHARGLIVRLVKNHPSLEVLVKARQRIMELGICTIHPSPSSLERLTRKNIVFFMFRRRVFAPDQDAGRTDRSRFPRISTSSRKTPSKKSWKPSRRLSRGRRSSIPFKRSSLLSSVRPRFDRTSPGIGGKAHGPFQIHGAFHFPHRARDQGRGDRRASSPGTHRGYGAVLRGRPGPPVPDPSGGKEPVRVHQRNRRF